MSFTLFFILGLAAWLFISRKARAKRAADAKNWSVDFRNEPAIRPITRRLPWKDL
jgi:hypothetical protein